MKNILIAPNAFKHSLPAVEVADALKKGLLKSQLKCRLKTFPIGDGGDGTAQLLLRHFAGKTINKTVFGPLGNPIKTSFSLIHGGKTAVIEMAGASGLQLLNSKELQPMETNSKGTGELIKAALDHKVEKIIIGMGGSATIDGGCGILSALGIRFTNSAGKSLTPTPKGLAGLDKIDSNALDSRLQNCELVVMCDVNNKLLGKNGAAAIFGPQKGASPKEVQELDSFLRKLKTKTHQVTGKDISVIPYGGTAGGAAAGVHAFINAKLVSGITYFLHLTHFENTLKNMDYLLTGEGRIDAQTPEGKGPAGVAQIAKKHSIPCIAIAGQVPLSPSSQLTALFDSLVPINHEASSLKKACFQTENNLIRTGKMIGDLLNQ